MMLESATQALQAVLRPKKRHERSAPQMQTPARAKSKAALVKAIKKARREQPMSLQKETKL